MILRILKEKGDEIFKEELEPMEEPFDSEEAPEPTSEEIPTEELPVEETVNEEEIVNQDPDLPTR